MNFAGRWHWVQLRPALAVATSGPDHQPGNQPATGAIGEPDTRAAVEPVVVGRRSLGRGRSEILDVVALYKKLGKKFQESRG